MKCWIFVFRLKKQFRKIIFFQNIFILNAVKKILLNFLQLVSLASGLPLEWPFEVETMFEGFNTMSSAGSNLMIPDCELTAMRTSDAFYYKQMMFVFLPPTIVLVCIFSWSTIWCCCANRCCAKRCRLKWNKLKDYTILSIVLMLFLSYSMLVKLAFSSLKCPIIDGKHFLMADLQEPCYEGRHMTYVMLLTLPQIMLYVFGLPALVGLLILRNKEHLHKRQFFTRYGLLYMGCKLLLFPPFLFVAATCTHKFVQLCVVHFSLSPFPNPFLSSFPLCISPFPRFLTRFLPSPPPCPLSALSPTPHCRSKRPRMVGSGRGDS
jgi:hypothetical protein